MAIKNLFILLLAVTTSSAGVILPRNGTMSVLGNLTHHLVGNIPSSGNSTGINTTASTVPDLGKISGLLTSSDASASAYDEPAELSKLLGFTVPEEDASWSDIMKAADLPHDYAQTICANWDSRSCSNNAIVWEFSLANYVLEAWMLDNGPTANGGWLNALDENTTADGSHASVMSDCHVIHGSCPIPEVACVDFTPTSYYFIRRAANGFNTAISAFYDNLVANTITDNLRLDQMVDDFASQALNDQQNSICPKTVMADTSSAMGIASGVTGAISAVVEDNPFLGFISGIFGAIGGAFGEAANNMPDCPVADISDIETTVSSALGDFFDQGRKTLTQILEAAMNGDGMDLTTLPGYNSSDPEHPIVQLFSGGKWLIPNDASMDQFAGAFMDATVQNLQQALVNKILKAAGLFIFANTDIKSAGDCAAVDGGARWLDSNSVCLILSDDKDNGDAASDAINKLETYGVVVDDLYSYSYDCFLTRNYTGSSSVPTAEAAENWNQPLPECFYDVFVVQGAKPSDSCDVCPSKNVDNQDGGWTTWCTTYCGCSGSGSNWNCPSEDPQELNCRGWDC